MKQTTDTSMVSTAQQPHASSFVRPPLIPRKKNAQEERGISDYLHMLKKRWKIAALVAAGSFLFLTIVILMMPATYRADVLVLLQPPSVTTAQAVIAQPDVRQKLDALREQVESRRTLDEVIKKFDLYSEKQGVIPKDEIFEMVRRSISLKQGKSSFSIFFEHQNPQIAADVANDLARYYIEENTRLRRRTLEDTSKFIQSQLKRLEKEVKDMEAVLQKFRKEHMGGMPEDVPANQALLTSLSTQVAQTEANLEGERLRKRKTEVRIAEMVSSEIASRQKNIKNLQNMIRQFTRLEESVERSSREHTTEPATQQAVNVEHKPEPSAEETEIREKLAELEVKIKQAKALPTPNGSALDSPEVTRLKAEKKNLQDDLERIIAKASRPPAPVFDGGDTNPAGFDGGPESVEVELMREQLRVKELAVKDADRNVADLENMVKRGLIAEKLAEKARADRERVIVELRIQRSNLIRTKQKYIDELKGHEDELASMREFQVSWDEMLVKIQEIEAQRMRIVNSTPEDTLRNITGRIESLTNELAEMRKKQLQVSAKVFSSRGELARDVQEHENIMANLMRQQNDIQTMKTRIIDLDRKLTSSAKVLVEYPEYQRKYRTVTEQYEAMLKHKNQAEMERGVEDQMEGERMLIWDPAIPTTKPYKPKYLVLFAGNIMFSFGLAVGLALLLELMSPKFLNAEALQDRTGMEVLARFNRLAAQDVPAPLPSPVPQEAGKVVPLYNPRHRLSKQFLDCCCLLYKPESRWPRVVAVCSPGAGDGKSFVAANLAAALAISQHEPTLLIDANLRSPTLHQMFGKKQENGLAEAIEGGGVNAHPIGATQPCDLQLITAGVPQRHGAVLLASLRFREMISKITYDGKKPRIILDTPSVSSGADVDVLLDAVDGVLVVIRRGHSAIADVDSMLRRIPPEKLLGVVFNDQGV
ncbi:MAG TPA: hypothetical protein VEK08_25905 [Planctomycetota bacterium]|nr:hypothetical protein [Planctomycetota bacterium]